MVCEGKCSNPTKVTSGVPQGTVLGPLLFLLHVNDQPNNLKSTIGLLADNALLYGIVSNDVDGDQLRENLKKLEVWQSTWQMSFNPAKCKTNVSQLRKSPSPTEKVCLLWSRAGASCLYFISTVGVILNNNLKWSNHVLSISGKANKVLGLIKRNLWNCYKQVKETAYTARMFVCSLLFVCAACLLIYFYLVSRPPK